MNADGRQFILSLADEATVDLFAGGGGMSTAIEQALLRHVDIAANHNDDALSMHRANHPQTKHFKADVFELDPRELMMAIGKKAVGLLHLSPDCFPAGTLIQTATGYRPIEKIRSGDMVLTHNNRWRRVTNTMTSKRELAELRGKGHHGLRVSREHPIYERRRTEVWDNKKRQYQPSYTEPKWCRAGDCAMGSYWATPRFAEQLPIPEMAVMKTAVRLPIDERLMWLAGRYLGDGWTRQTATRSELVIICGKHEVEKLGPALDLWPRTATRSTKERLAWQYREVRTAGQFTANSRALVSWLREHFGHGAGSKRVPGWALGMSESMRGALLAGYLGADGWKGLDWKGHEIVESNSISPALSYGIKALATTLGHSVCAYRASRAGSIEGRKVNCKPVYALRWRVFPKRKSGIVDDLHQWSAIRDRINVPGLHTVYNLSVEEDESYIAEGIVVHNCTHHSQASAGQPRDKRIRGLSWIALRWIGAYRPRVVTLENVIQILKWGPLIAKRDPHTGRVIKLVRTATKSKSGKIKTKTTYAVAEKGERVPLGEQFLIPDPKRIGKTWRRFVFEIERHGYTVAWSKINAADHGANTTRERLFWMARCDGEPIVFPEPTFFKKPKGKQKKWRAAAECIDFSLPCPSIFDRKKDLADPTHVRIAKGVVKYVLECADPFIVDTSNFGGLPGEGGKIAGPAIVHATHQGSDRVHDATDAAPTVTGAHRGELMLSAPILAKMRFDSDGGPLTKPLPVITSGAGAERPAGCAHAMGIIVPHLQQITQGGRIHEGGRPLPVVTTAKGGEQSLVAATLIQAAHGEGKPDGVRRWGSGARDVRDSVGAVVGSGSHALAEVHLARQSVQPDAAKTREAVPSNADRTLQVAAFLAQHNTMPNGGVHPGHAATEPVSSITGTGSQQGLVAASLLPLRHNCSARGAKDALQAISAGGEHHGVTAATLVTNTTGHAATDLRDPTATLTTGQHQALLECTLHAHGGQTPQSPTVVSFAEAIDEINVIAAGASPLTDRSGLSPEHEAGALRVAAFLIRYYGEGGQWGDLRQPFATMTTKDRLALVTVWIKGHPYVIVDIGLRMLTPRELYLAQGFPANYIIDRGHDGRKFSKSAQVRMVGNSVSPPPAFAFLRANFPPVQSDRTRVAA